MKTILPLLALALTAGLPAYAADPAPATAAPRAAAPAATAPAKGDFAARLQEITAQLNLTEAQKAKITPIVQQEIADLGALKQDAGAQRHERMQRAREINQKASKQVRAELTPEQQKKYDELRAAARQEMKEKAKERRAAAGA